MDEYPDSVLQLLNIQPEEIEDFSDKECARYALLLARATDKCEQSLLPCDSLLNIALEYYDDEELDRFRGVEADAYDEDAVNEFRDVLYTLQEIEVAGWLRSLQLRAINLPDELKDEAFLIVGERRIH